MIVCVRSMGGVEGGFASGDFICGGIMKFMIGMG